MKEIKTKSKVMDDQVPIDSFLEDNATEITSEYLKWVNRFFEMTIDEKNLISFLRSNISDEYSHAYHSAVFERSPVLDNSIYKTCRLIARDYYLKQNNITEMEVNDFKRKQKTQMGYFYILFTSLFPIIKTLLKQIYYIAINKIFSNSVEFYNTNDQFSVFTYAPNFDLKNAAGGIFTSNYFNAAHKVLNNLSDNINYILFYCPSNEVSFYQLVKYKNKFNQSKEKQKFFVLEDFFSMSDFIQLIKEYCFVVKKTVRLIDLYDNFQVTDRVNNFQIFYRTWIDTLVGNTSIYRLIRRQQLLNMSKNLPKQKIILYVAESQTWEYALNCAWKKYQKSPTIAYQHIMCRPLDLRYFFAGKREHEKYFAILPDLNLITGAIAKELMLRDGYSGESLVKVDAVRYSYLSDSFMLYKNKNVDQGITLLVIIGYTREEADFQLNMLYEALKNDSDHRVQRLIFKYHPFSRFRISFDRFSKLGLEVCTTNDNLKDLWSQIDKTYCSNLTSVSMEAGWLGIYPIITCPNNSLNLSHLYGIKNIAFAKNAIELKNKLGMAVDFTAFNDLFYFSKNMELWDSFFKSVIKNEVKR